MPNGKPDAAVERLVRKYRRKHRATSVNPGKHASKLRYDNVLSIDELRAIITEARQSAARECVEIVADSDVETCGGYERQDDGRATLRTAAKAIREHFGLEGK